MAMPHPLNRPYQQPVYNRIIASPKKWVIVRAPTGSGKSAFVAQAGHDGNRVMVLVKTKVLQEQYAQSYQFRVVKGKGSYPCLGNFAPACDLCHLDKKSKESECNPHCPYPAAVDKMLASDFACLNYSKYLLEIRDNGLVRQFEPDILFLDECHQLSDVTIDWSGLIIAWDKVSQYVEPEFISPHAPQTKQIKLASDWLNGLRKELSQSEPPVPLKGASEKEIREYRAWDVLYKKVKNVLEYIDTGSEYWFCQSDFENGFRLRPLTARFHFKRLFEKASKMVLMSATIKEDDLRELGIYDDYEFIEVPNPIPASERPIEDLLSPPYTAKSEWSERQYHAQVIANRIRQCPDNWTGLVHVTSGKMADELGDFLKRMTGRPVWTPPENQGTEQALSECNEFLASKGRKAGLAVTWQFYEGVDMGNINIVVSARIPYPDFSEPFEKQRFDFDKKAANSRVANLLEQQQGRNRRGHAHHYGAEAEKLNCLADGKWTRIRSSLSKDFTSAIVEVRDELAF